MSTTSSIQSSSVHSTASSSDKMPSIRFETVVGDLLQDILFLLHKDASPLAFQCIQHCTSLCESLGICLDNVQTSSSSSEEAVATAESSLQASDSADLNADASATGEDTESDETSSTTTVNPDSVRNSKQLSPSQETPLLFSLSQFLCGSLTQLIRTVSTNSSPPWDVNELMDCRSFLLDHLFGFGLTNDEHAGIALQHALCELILCELSLKFRSKYSSQNWTDADVTWIVTLVKLPAQILKMRLTVSVKLFDPLVPLALEALLMCAESSWMENIMGTRGTITAVSGKQQHAESSVAGSTTIKSTDASPLEQKQTREQCDLPQPIAQALATAGHRLSEFVSVKTESKTVGSVTSARLVASPLAVDIPPVSLPSLQSAFLNPLVSCSLRTSSLKSFWFLLTLLRSLLTSLENNVVERPVDQLETHEHLLTVIALAISHEDTHIIRLGLALLQQYTPPNSSLSLRVLRIVHHLCLPLMSLPSSIRDKSVALVIRQSLLQTVVHVLSTHPLSWLTATIAEPLVHRESLLWEIMNELARTVQRAVIDEPGQPFAQAAVQTMEELAVAWSTVTVNYANATGFSNSQRIWDDIQSQRSILNQFAEEIQREPTEQTLQKLIEACQCNLQTDLTTSNEQQQEPSPNSKLPTNHFSTESTALHRAARILLSSSPPASLGDLLGKPQHALWIIALSQLCLSDEESSLLLLLPSLRRFVQSVPLPGEGQAVERVLDSFARAFFTKFPQACIEKGLSSTDAVHLVVTALIMLNTSLHHPHAPRMTRKQFMNQFKETDGIEVQHIRTFLNDSYTDIQQHELGRLSKSGMNANTEVKEGDAPPVVSLDSLDRHTPAISSRLDALFLYQDERQTQRETQLRNRLRGLCLSALANPTDRLCNSEWTKECEERRVGSSISRLTSPSSPKKLRDSNASIKPVVTLPVSFHCIHLILPLTSQCHHLSPRALLRKGLDDVVAPLTQTLIHLGTSQHDEVTNSSIAHGLSALLRTASRLGATQTLESISLALLHQCLMSTQQRGTISVEASDHPPLSALGSFLETAALGDPPIVLSTRGWFALLSILTRPPITNHSTDSVENEKLPGTVWDREGATQAVLASLEQVLNMENHTGSNNKRDYEEAQTALTALIEGFRLALLHHVDNSPKSSVGEAVLERKLRLMTRTLKLVLQTGWAFPTDSSESPSLPSHGCFAGLSQDLTETLCELLPHVATASTEPVSKAWTELLELLFVKPFDDFLVCHDASSTLTTADTTTVSTVHPVKHKGNSLPSFLSLAGYTRFVLELLHACYQTCLNNIYPQNHQIHLLRQVFVQWLSKTLQRLWRVMQIIKTSTNPSSTSVVTVVESPSIQQWTKSFQFGLGFLSAIISCSDSYWKTLGRQEKLGVSGQGNDQWIRTSTKDKATTRPSHRYKEDARQVAQNALKSLISFLEQSTQQGKDTTTVAAATADADDEVNESLINQSQQLFKDEGEWLTSSSSSDDEEEDEENSFNSSVESLASHHSDWESLLLSTIFALSPYLDGSIVGKGRHLLQPNASLLNTATDCFLKKYRMMEDTKVTVETEGSENQQLSEQKQQLQKSFPSTLWRLAVASHLFSLSQIQSPSFPNTLQSLLSSHFKPDPRDVTTVRHYCTQILDELLLLGGGTTSTMDESLNNVRNPEDPNTDINPLHDGLLLETLQQLLLFPFEYLYDESTLGDVTINPTKLTDSEQNQRDNNSTATLQRSTRQPWLLHHLLIPSTTTTRSQQPLTFRHKRSSCHHLLQSLVQFPTVETSSIVSSICFWLNASQITHQETLCELADALATLLNKATPQKAASHLKHILNSLPNIGTVEKMTRRGKEFHNDLSWIPTHLLKETSGKTKIQDNTESIITTMETTESDVSQNQMSIMRHTPLDPSLQAMGYSRHVIVITRLLNVLWKRIQTEPEHWKQQQTKKQNQTEGNEDLNPVSSIDRNATTGSMNPTVISSEEVDDQFITSSSSSSDDWNESRILLQDSLQCCLSIELNTELVQQLRPFLNSHHHPLTVVTQQQQNKSENRNGWGGDVPLVGTKQLITLVSKTLSVLLLTECHNTVESKENCQEEEDDRLMLFVLNTYRDLMKINTSSMTLEEGTTRHTLAKAFSSTIRHWMTQYSQQKKEKTTVRIYNAVTEVLKVSDKPLANAIACYFEQVGKEIWDV